MSARANADGRDDDGTFCDVLHVSLVPETSATMVSPSRRRGPEREQQQQGSSRREHVLRELPRGRGHFRVHHLREGKKKDQSKRIYPPLNQEISLSGMLTARGVEGGWAEPTGVEGMVGGDVGKRQCAIRKPVGIVSLILVWPSTPAARVGMLAKKKKNKKNRGQRLLEGQAECEISWYARR